MRKKKIQLCVAFILGVLFLQFYRNDYDIGFKPFFNGFGTVNYQIIPFLQFFQIQLTYEHIIKDVILNLIMYIPLTLILLALDETMKLKDVLIVTLTVSFICELSSYILCIGYFDTTDIILNLISCIIGYGIYQLFMTVYQKLRPLIKN